MACLDTSILIDVLGRGGRRAARAAQTIIRREAEKGEALCTTRLNVAELWVGVFRSADPEREAETLDYLLRDFTILELDEPAARVFGNISAELQRRGRPVGDMDTLIAAIAISNGERLITGNPRHFLEIPGLRH